jgi:ligand-binding sensor domain-containing protein
MNTKSFSIILAGLASLFLTRCGPTPVHFNPVTLDPSQLAFQTRAAEWTNEPPRQTATPSIDPSAPVAAVIHTNWDYSAGSPNNHIHIVNDPTSRYIWAATEAGVVQFDVQTALYKIHNRANGLPDNEVMDIGITPDGRVWAGTRFGGLAMYDGTKWKWYTSAQGLPSDGVSEISISPTGNLWLGYLNGSVSRLDGTQWTHWTADDGLGSDEVTFLDLSDPERPVAYTKGNKYFYNGAAWSYSDFPPNGYTIVDAAFSADGNTQWFAASDGPGGKGGLVEVKNGKATLFANGSRIRGTHAYGMAVDREKILWIGTDKGLVRYDGKTWVTYTTAQGLPSNAVRDVVATSEGKLFVATDNGLASMGKNAYQWVVMAAEEITEDRYSLPIKALAFDQTNALWISYADGIHRLEGTSATFFNKTVIKYKVDLNAILPSADGTVWFLGDTQIVRYVGGAWKVLYASSGFPLTTVQAYTIDAAGRLWIGQGRVLAYYQNNKWTKQTIPGGLQVQPKQLTSLAVTADGTIWAGSAEGLYEFREGTWSYVDVFTMMRVHSITPDANGRIWAVAGENVVMYDGNAWMMYEGEGNFTEPIERIAESRDGKLYFIMASRFVIFDGAATKVVGRAEGFPGGRVTGVAFGEDNAVWFGTEYGLEVYHPD